MDGHSMVLDVGVALHRDRLLGRRGGAIVGADDGLDAELHRRARPTPASSTDAVVIDDRCRGHGGGDYPSFTVEASVRWSAFGGHFVIKTGSGILGMSVWDVGKVPRHPCHWRGRLYDPGPTVDDLVEALARQPLRNATKPTDVTLAGYRGRYLEWSVPSDMIVPEMPTSKDAISYRPTVTRTS